MKKNINTIYIQKVFSFVTLLLLTFIIAFILGGGTKYSLVDILKYIRGIGTEKYEINQLLTVGYDMKDNHTIISNSNDGQIYLPNGKRQITNLCIIFDEKLEYSVPVQIYYALGDEGFSEENSIWITLREKTSYVEIPLQMYVTKLRVDIGSDKGEQFKIKVISVNFIGIWIWGKICLYWIVILVIILIFVIVNRKRKYLQEENICVMNNLVRNSLVIAIILEVLVFNFKFFTTHDYNKEDISNMFEAVNMEKNGEDYLVTGESPYILFENLDCDIKTMYLNMSSGYINISTSDDGNSGLVSQPGQMIIQKFEKTKYCTLHMAGNVHMIKVSFDNHIDDIIQINNIYINKPYAFIFEIDRFIFVFITLLFIQVFLKSSRLWELKYIDLRKKYLILWGIVGFHIVLFYFISHLNTQWVNNEELTRSGYHMLAQAFCKGQTYLDYEVPEWLRNLANPYDISSRGEFANIGQNGYLWDFAYYNGKYYVYFGALPAILFNLPYYVITGGYFPTNISVWICCSLYIIGGICLIDTIVSKYYKNASVALTFFLDFLYINTTGMIASIRRPDHYCLPIVMAVMLGTWGIFFWLSAYNEKQERICKWRLFCGSLCMSLISLCRPQILVVIFLGIIIFWNLIGKRGMLKEFIVLLIPIVSIALVAMSYNFVRFGSVFDFGANYNLTTNDMTKRGIELGRTALGFFYMLFQPLNISTTFPFINLSVVNTNYIGATIQEPSYGGVIAMNLLLLLPFFVIKFKGIMKNRTMYWIASYNMLSSMLLIFVDVQMAGMLPRYQMDFQWILLISASLIILSLDERVKEVSYRKFLRRLFVFLAIIAIVVNYLVIFTDATFEAPMAEKNPEFYYKVERLVEFWR